jgi:putative nucleotidyltransferase with HDIG domain
MEKKAVKIAPYIYFSIVTLLIIVLFPREGKFRYSFMEGRPWKYSLLIAPFDFPIDKTTGELKKEQEAVIQNIYPYFRIDKEITQKQIQRFDETYKKFPPEFWDLYYKQYVDRVLKEIYAIGIVSNEESEFLASKQYTAIKVLDNSKEAVPVPVGKIFTIKSAYSYILEKRPPELDINILRLGSLNNYLQINCKYDEALTEKVKQEELQKIAPSDGMVQAGQKIVDRGEIVTEKTYNILRSLKQIYDQESGSVQRQSGFTLGTSIWVVALMASLLFYLIYFRKKIFIVAKNVVFLLSMSVFFILLTEITVSYELFNIYIIPYAIIPVVIRTFFESRTAQTTHLITILICSLMIPFPFEFILIQFVVCMVAVYMLKDLTQRSELIKCALAIFVAYIITYLGFLLLQDGNLSQLNWYVIIYFGINFLFVMFTYSFIYILEKIFGYISNVTLVELSDINTAALSTLSETCPGTFQHSLQVSMLGTAAATKIGANAQLVRTGALYHDLGKMDNPAYFTENCMGNVNPHDKLTLEESARIITGHVPAGVKKASEYNLPPAIVKFIQTHHGKGKAKYFYNMFRNQHPDAPVDEEIFSYKGYNPDTKETAILMMADSVEAASRSLPDYSEESIRQLVNKIIDSQIADGLLNNAPLTFSNITTIKQVFIDKLTSMYHSRIVYPELKEK